MPSSTKTRKENLRAVMEGKENLLASDIYVDLASNGTPWIKLGRGKATTNPRGLLRQMTEYLKNMREVTVEKKRTSSGYINHYNWVG